MTIDQIISDIRKIGIDINIKFMVSVVEKPSPALFYNSSSKPTKFLKKLSKGDILMISIFDNEPTKGKEDRFFVENITTGLKYSSTMQWFYQFWGYISNKIEKVE